MITLPRWHLPALQTLHVISPGPVDWHAVELPQLKRLVIEWQDCGDRLLARLASAPLLDQLDALVLSQIWLTTQGVRTLLDHADRFGRIRRLVLVSAETDHNQMDRLAERFPCADISYQEFGFGVTPEATRFWTS